MRVPILIVLAFITAIHGGGQTAKSVADTKTPTSPSSTSRSGGDSEAGKNIQSAPDKVRSVNVRELPPVSVSKDWADWTLWLASGILAIVGVLGIGLAYKTLRAIERQGLSMRRQTTHLRRSVVQARRAARAAQVSADALINSERAWVLVQTASLVLEANGKYVIRPSIQNFGKTIARMRRVSLGGARPRQISEKLTAPPVYEGATEFDFILCPEQEFPREEVPFVPINSENLDAVRARVLKLYVYGLVEYLDLAGNERCYGFRSHLRPATVHALPERPVRLLQSKLAPCSPGTASCVLCKGAGFDFGVPSAQACCS